MSNRISKPHRLLSVLILAVLTANIAMVLNASDQTTTNIPLQFNEKTNENIPNQTSAFLSNEDLLAQYTFEDPYKVGKDDSGNQHDGTVEYAQQVSDPERGNVLNYYAQNSRMLLGNAIDLPSNYTISVWFKNVSIYAGRWNMLATSQYGGYPGVEDRISGYSNYRLGVFVNNSWVAANAAPGHLDAETYINVYVNGWHHLAITASYDGVNAQTNFYIDGQWICYSLNRTDTDIFAIGNSYRAGANYRFAHYLDDFRVYGRNLTLSEINQLYTESAEVPWYTGAGSDSYQYRFRMESESNMMESASTTMVQAINFTDQFGNMHLAGSVDTSKIKMVEYDESTRTYSAVSDAAFTQATNYAANVNEWGNITWTKADSDFIVANSTDFPGYISDWNLYNLYTGAEYDGSEYNEVDISKFYNPGDAVGFNTTSNTYYPRKWTDYYSNEPEVDMGKAFNSPITLATYGYAQSYVYFPAAVNDCYAWIITRRGDNHVFWFDSIYPLTGAAYTYPLPNTALTTLYLNSTHMATRYKISASSNQIEAGWHSFMLRPGNVNTTDYQNFDFCVKLTTSSTDFNTPILGLKTSNYRISENRVYYVYFNATIAGVSANPQYNIYGTMNMNNDTSSYVQNNYVNVFPAEYNGYSTKLAAIKDTPWWNEEWSFRILVNVSSPYWNYYYSDALIETEIDFTTIFEDLGVETTFDINSIRVVEYDEYFNTHTSIPCQFDEGLNFISDSNAIGTLSWVAPGKTTTSRMRFYYVYFDNMEYGGKQAVNYNTGLVLTQNSADDYTMENNKIKVSLCEGDPPGITDTFDQIYNVTDKRSGNAIMASTYAKGWDISYWDYGSTGAISTFNLMGSIEIVSEGDVKITLKMTYEHPTNFKYERFYTLNYLDDTIRMTHKITAKTSLGQGYWRIKSNWNPEINSGFGLGGYDFQTNSNTTIDGSTEFSNSNTITTLSLGGTSQYRKYMEDSWYTLWNNTKSYGVGTIWTKGQFNSINTPYNTWLYQIDLGANGLANTLYFRPQGISAPNSYNFTIYGQIYNGYTGEITKLRANGLQTPLNCKYGNVELDNFGKIKIKLLDNENLPIYNATVKIFKAGDTNIQMRSSDTQGNVTFKGLTDATWQIEVYYLVNNQVNYTIYSTTETITRATQVKYYETYNCNLTTLAITVVDSGILDPLYNKLMANVTIYNATDNTQLTSYFSDAYGAISIQLPMTDWRFKVMYQNKLRDFEIMTYATGLAQEHDLSISAAMVTIFNITTAVYKTNVAIVYANASNWQFSFPSVSSPLSLYWGDTLNVEYNFTQVTPIVINYTRGVDDIIDGTWQLIRTSDNTVVDSSLNLNAFDNFQDGLYRFSLTTTGYSAGTYILRVKMTYFNNTSPTQEYQDYTIDLSIRLLEFITKLDFMNDTSALRIYWNQTLRLQFLYTSSSPEIRYLASGTLNYQIVGTGYTGVLTPVGSQAGNYSLQIADLNLEIGSYTLRIYGGQSNYMNVDENYIIEILANPTKFNVIIGEPYRFTSTYMKGAASETVFFQVNFTNNAGEFLGNDVIVAGSFTDITGTLNFIYDQKGIYNCSINVNDYVLGSHKILIQAEKHFYISQQIELDIEFVDFWDTEIVIIDPPQFYAWGDNASFIILYQSVDTPRTTWILDNAQITQLNITYKIEKTEYNQICLTSETRNQLWGWSNLGSGYYEVWMNTSVVNLTNTMAFYAIPSINMSVFRQATARPYVWIAPAMTTLTATTSVLAKNTIDILRLKLDQSADIVVHYNVTGECALKTFNVANAKVYFQINDGAKIQLTELGAGRYGFKLNAVTLGEFTIKITATIENFTAGSAQFTFYCDRKPISFGFSGNIQAGQQSIITPQNHKINFTLELNDTVHGGVLSDATIKVVFNNVETLFYEDAPNTGRYTIIINEDVLAPLELETAYTLTIFILKANYTADNSVPNGIEAYPIEIAVTLTLPVDPYIGIPYMYWQIIAITIAIMIGIYATSAAIKNARIPMIIKVMKRTEKIISGKKSMPEGRVTKTMEEDLVDKYSKDWQLLDLNLRNIMGLDKKPGDSSTPSDKQGGQ